MMSDIKSQAKSSHNTKLHALGGKGTVGKQLPMGAGSTWNGVAGVDSGQLADEQRIKTRKDGGRVSGAKAKVRLDRKAKNDHDEDDGYNKGGRVARASGGKVGGKGKTNITIVMAPGQGGSQGSPQAVPVPRPVPIPVQASPAAAGPPPPIGAGAPPMMPPSGPPMGMARKAGGRVNRADGGSTGAGVPDRDLSKMSDAEQADSEGSSGHKSSQIFAGGIGSAATPTHRTSTPRNRASGGKVTVGKGLGLTAGGGSGAGRIQKAAMQKRTYP